MRRERDSRSLLSEAMDREREPAWARVSDLNAVRRALADRRRRAIVLSLGIVVYVCALAAAVAMVVALFR
jgi:hypothetical protein